MFGLPADTVRKKFRTRCVRDNALNPVFDDEPFVFKKVVLPELASIRITAYEEGGKSIGHRVLPVIGMCPGYKHVTLRTDLGLPIPLATLFLCIVVKVSNSEMKRLNVKRFVVVNASQCYFFEQQQQQSLCFLPF